MRRSSSTARRFAASARVHGALLILNDRPGPGRSRPAPTAYTSARTTRRWPRRASCVGPERIVGLSTHTPAQIDAAPGRRLHRRRPGARDTDQARAAGGRARSSCAYAAGHAARAVLRDRRDRREQRRCGARGRGRRVAVVRALTEARRTRDVRPALASALDVDPVRGGPRWGSVAASAGSARRPRDLGAPRSSRAAGPRASGAAAAGGRSGPERDAAAAGHARAARAGRAPVADRRRRRSLAALTGGVQLVLCSWPASKLKVAGTHAAAGSTIAFAVLMFVCAIGMWLLRYWAVLGFMALLAIAVINFALALLEGLEPARACHRGGRGRRSPGSCSASSSGCWAGSRCPGSPAAEDVCADPAPPVGSGSRWPKPPMTAW